MMRMKQLRITATLFKSAHCEMKYNGLYTVVSQEVDVQQTGFT